MQNLKLSLDFIQQIMVHELGLKDNRVNIYNQKFMIPNDDKIFLTLEYKGSPTIISSRNTLVDILGVTTEVSDINTQEHIVVGVFSRNLEAIQRKEEVVMALYSVYSQQLQEVNSFSIFRGARIEDLSFLEGAAILYRYDVSFVVHAWYNKVKPQEWYDANQVFVRVNDGSPDMTDEFTQSSTFPV